MVQGLALEMRTDDCKVNRCGCHLAIFMRGSG